jgi:hypothetical protein
MSAAPGVIARPSVTLAETHDDWAWFGRGRRRYRVRRAPCGGWWLVRRRSGGMYLRAWLAQLPPGLADDDKTIRPYWFLAAWPDLPATKRAELVKDVRKLERG